VFIVGLIVLTLKKRAVQQVSFIASVISGTIICYGVCALLLKMSVIGRYFLVVYPLVLLIAAAGINSIPKKSISFLCCLVFIMPLGLFYAEHVGAIKGTNISSYPFPNDYTRHYADFFTMAESVKHNYEDLDIVVIKSADGIFGLHYYLDQKNAYPIKKVLFKDPLQNYYVSRYKKMLIYGLDNNI